MAQGVSNKGVFPLSPVQRRYQLLGHSDPRLMSVLRHHPDMEPKGKRILPSPRAPEP